MKFKNITEVEEVSEVKETDKVILNVDGKAKQANANLIKPKEKEHLYIKAEVKTTPGGPDGSPPATPYYSLIESNLKYNLLMEGIKKHDYPLVALEIQVEPGVFMNVRTYGSSVDLTKIPDMDPSMNGLLLLYDNFILSNVASFAAVIVKSDDTVDFLDL